MLKIGEFSKIAKTTIKTLRYYDDIGLFKPFFVDKNGYRYYELDQLKELLKIIELRSFDLSIEDILDIFNGKDEKEILHKHIKVLELEKRKKTHQIASLKKILKGENMRMKFEYKIKEIKENIVYYRHGKINAMDDLFNFVIEAGEMCRKINPSLKCKDYCYITYSSNEYIEKDIELEYVEAVTSKGNETSEIKFRLDPLLKRYVLKLRVLILIYQVVMNLL